jgi:hypothetical protein
MVLYYTLEDAEGFHTSNSASEIPGCMEAVKAFSKPILAALHIQFTCKEDVQALAQELKTLYDAFDYARTDIPDVEPPQTIPAVIAEGSIEPLTTPDALTPPVELEVIDQSSLSAATAKNDLTPPAELTLLDPDASLLASHEESDKDVVIDSTTSG